MSYQETTTTRLREILNGGVVRFQFRKKDGSIRNALGTRNVDLIPKEEYVKYIDDINEKKSVVFFDLEERDFRSLMTGVEVAVL
jgi:thiamine monophosphate synthase